MEFRAQDPNDNNYVFFSQEVETLANELRYQLDALDEILSIAKLNDFATPEQLNTVKRISPTVQGLLRCLHDQHSANQDHIMSGSTIVPRRLSEPDKQTLSSRSAKNLMKSATSTSTRKLLENVLEHTKPGRRHKTVFARWDVDEEEDEFEAKLPKDLLLKMVNSRKSMSARSSVAYIAQTYGGVQFPQNVEKRRKSSLNLMAHKVLNSNVFVKGLVEETLFGTGDKSEVIYLPTEFKTMSYDNRLKLAKMLSWDSLKVWGLDVFEVEKISSHQNFSMEENPDHLDDSNRLGLEITERGCPIMLIGWAILASPYSQLAMARNVNDTELIDQAVNIIKLKANNNEYSIAASLCEEFEKQEMTVELDDGKGLVGYYLLDKYGVTPRAICHFLRKVEKEYPARDVNPYHNNIHASDVIQTTHALIQLGGANLAQAYDSLEIFTILIAAALHDVRHPGTNNAYQVNKQTDLALIYNDQSVLENMHASCASRLLKESGGAAENDNSRTESIFGKMLKEDICKVRAGIIRAILSTDMSHHFKSVAKMKNYIADVLDEINCEMEELPRCGPISVLGRLYKSEHAKLREKLLPFILHLADISNPSKPPDVSIEWSNSAYAEFFQQGDLEASEGMPISPLCDRTTTSPPDGQVGFITYVVKPAFQVLEKCLPEVSAILTQLDENLKYWQVFKDAASSNDGQKGVE